MTGVRLQTPQPLDLVGDAATHQVIAATERDLQELERRAEVAVAEAQEAEREAREGGADVATTPWALVRLQGFLDTLRDEVERDVALMLDAATRHGGASGGGAEASPGLTLRPPAPVVTSPEPVPEFVPPAAFVPPEPVPEFVPPAPVPSAAFVPPAPAYIVATPAAPPAPPSPVVPEPEPVSESPFAALARDVAEAVDEPAARSAPQPVVIDAQPAPSTFEAEDSYDISLIEPPAARRKLTSVVPLSAVLEATAVVLIMVFILLRLG